MSLRIEKLVVDLGSFQLGPIDLELNHGEYIGIVGPSGSGKTTLLRAIAGLERPARGKIILSDQILLEIPGKSLPPEKRRIGMVFQNLALWPHLTVQGHLELVLCYSLIPPEKIKARVSELLDMVRLRDREDRKPSELSGGEAQRLALARALAADPLLLLLDEPFAHLDPTLREELSVEIQKIHRLTKIPVVHVTHDPSELVGVCQKFALIRGGKVEQIGPLAELFQHPATPFVAEFLRPMRGLAEKLKGLEDGVP